MRVAYLEEVPFSPPTQLGPFRREHYDGLPDEPRCELIYGRFYLSPAPLPLHQRVLFELAQILDAAARSAGGEIFIAPLDVVLADHSVVQPDILYLTAAHRSLVGRGIEGAPDLAVEILSPGSARRDRVQKLNLYAESGIREYWLIDPEERQVDFLINQEGRFVVAPQRATIYQSPLFPEICLDLGAFWRRVEERQR